MAKVDHQLRVVAGDGKELGRQMLRVHLDRRYEEARALVDRIAHRASLTLIDRRQPTIAASDGEGKNPKP
ncbi:MAG: hypothetical protein JSS45_10580 [Proteobacteria bacterium]|nr:hypothetical protein [Pseudomonadota bacterium]